MMLIFSLGLDLFSAGLILVPLYLLLDRVRFHNLRKTASYCIFSFYLVAVYALVGMPCITYISPDLNLNLIPFLDMVGDLRSTLLNVVLFVPLGLMLPLIWEKYRTGKNAVLFGLGMSLAIELLQILTLRATDINDLITNTLGTFLGFLIAKVLMGKFPALRELIKEWEAWEVYAVCAAVFAIMFLIEPFIFTFFWDLILH